MAVTEIARKNARKQVEMFKREYKRGIVRLACHAALPVVLNAELLHLLRINFFLDTSEPLSYLEESDLLLSFICQEIGADLYEIDSEVRNMLLHDLREEYGHVRIQKIAGLLWQYIEHRSPWEDHIRLKRAQQLTALNFLNSKEAERWISQAKENAAGREDAGLKDWFVAIGVELLRRTQLDVTKAEAETHAPQIRLRREPGTFSEDEIKIRIKQLDFRDSSWNPQGSCPHEYELKGVNNEQVVYDRMTGLMWQQSGSADWLTWEEAQEYVAAVKRQGFAGFSDWRLPTIEELASLLEPQKQSNGLYINPVFDDKQRWCWSVDRRIKGESGSSSVAWYVYFNYGSVGWDGLYYKYFVRCVRS